ncbi:MAG TPA: aminotransferase class I/II-fold pyridoxal phosphate-dependent enzyme [Rubrivivax sp.]|nr:aminotransferase class I/II-fold pyridoxal phosphate-dependent enzyme [Rubrivivax sp.]
MRRVHGGGDAQGAARWDFSTCSNAAGPAPLAFAAVQEADATRYPDPASTAVRAALAALHGVAPARVLIAASASEFIQRITAVTARLWPGAVRVPRHAYGDYAHAAGAWGRALLQGDRHRELATLTWHADPGSPSGESAAPAIADEAALADYPTVLDAVYAPLRLSGSSSWTAAMRDAVFVLHSPNKALGLTGVRGAYAIAPAHAAYGVQACCAALDAAAPSWPLSAQGETMLLAWARPDVQCWVQDSHTQLAAWKRDLQAGLTARGFTLRESATHFFLVRPPRALDTFRLRAAGVALRDATSFGLPGWWRVSAQPPAAQQALWAALDAALARTASGSDVRGQEQAS